MCVFNVILLTKSISLSYKKTGLNNFLDENDKKLNFFFSFLFSLFIYFLKVQNTTKFFTLIFIHHRENATESHIDEH